MKAPGTDGWAAFKVADTCAASTASWRYSFFNQGSRQLCRERA